MSGWLEALFGKVFNSGVAVPLSKGINFASGLTAGLNQTTKQIDVNLTPGQSHANTLAPLLRGVGLTVDANGKLATRARPRLLQESDYFASGNLTSGSIGKLGWNLLGNGTPAYTKLSGQSLNTRKGQLTTSSALNDRAVLCWGETEARGIAIASELTIVQNFAKLVGATTRRVFIGLTSDFATDPTTVADCLGFIYDSGVSPNWQIIARRSSVGSAVDGGASFAAPADSGQLVTMVRLSSGTWQFYVGGSLLGSFASAAVPTAAMNIGYRVQTLAASAASFHTGYFGVEGAIAGVLDDDAFLEA